MSITKTLRRLVKQVNKNAVDIELTKGRLSYFLDEIHVCEAIQDYDKRNKFVMYALATALDIGMKAGVRIDPKEPEWPAVFIELPTGQVSWHVPQHVAEWDGHSTEEKYRRCNEYTESVDEVWK